MYAFRCPGCKQPHVYVTAEHTNGVGPTWTFDGNMDYPNFSPSLLNRWGTHYDPNWGADDPDLTPADRNALSGTCHLFVRNGMIEYCADSSHELAGKTVPMIDYESKL